MSEAVTIDTLEIRAPLDPPIVEITSLTPPPPPLTHLDSPDSLATPSLSTSTFQFKGQIFCLPDGTRWQMLEPLSTIRLQQVNAPCEATQVFTCLCLDEPYCNDGEAVVKIKFQVRACEKTIYAYKSWIRECEESLYNHPKNAALIRREVKGTRCLLDACTQPTDSPNQSTHDEAAALERLGNLACAHAPALLAFVISELQPGTHKEEIPGGFIVYTVMTKLPGKRIMYYDFWSRPLGERNEIRAAFKEALLAVWNCRIGPHDTAMRNILWDEERRKCYIVDFEDCAIADDDVRLPEWEDREFEAWNVAETCFRE